MRIAKSCVCCGAVKIDASPAILMPFISDRVFNWLPFEIDESLGLRTIKQGNAYALCNSLLCKNCHHLFLDMRFGGEEMEKLYQDYRGEWYVKQREFYEPGYREKNEALGKGYNYREKIEWFLKPHIKNNPTILDYGGGSGINTPFRETIRADIYDISNKTSPSRSQYDLLICSNVLEHIPFPAEVLKKISWYMDKTSILYIELPHENLIRESLYLDKVNTKKKHWHEHINFFNSKSIVEMLSRAKFNILEFRSLPITNETSDEVFQFICKRE